MSRRGESIYKRKDGRWEGRYIKGYDCDGKAKYSSVYSNSYLDVKRKLIEKKQTVALNNYCQNNLKITLREVLYLWVESNKINLKTQTYTKYKRLIETHIVTNIGAIKLHKINSKIINDFLLSKKTNGRLDKTGALSDNYVKTISFIINSSLKYAAKEGLCTPVILDNFKKSVKASKLEVLSVEEQAILENYVFSNYNNKMLGVLIPLYCGLRIGEVCALSWNDIDLENKTIHVQHSVCRVVATGIESVNLKTKLVLGSTKTESSNRIIPIPDKLLYILKKEKQSATEYIICGKTYPYTDPRTYQYFFHKCLKNCGIRDINYHALRHTFATRCVESGMDIKSLSEILGHSNVNITLNTYVHSSIDLKRKQLDKMIAFCGQNNGQSFTESLCI